MEAMVPADWNGGHGGEDAAIVCADEAERI